MDANTFENLIKMALYISISACDVDEALLERLHMNPLLLIQSLPISLLW